MGRAENIVAHQPLAEAPPAKPPFDFALEIFVACPHDRASPDSFTRPTFGKPLWYSEKIPESEPKNVAVQATGDVRSERRKYSMGQGLARFSRLAQDRQSGFFSVAV
jgi:hypothetical protein